MGKYDNHGSQPPNAPREGGKILELNTSEYVRKYNNHGSQPN